MDNQQENNPTQSQQPTFFSQEKIKCPVCRYNFSREEIRTGRGRLIAGDLTDELRRLYQDSPRYQAIVPLVYSMVVCPNCYFSAFNSDFKKLPSAVSNKLLSKIDVRKQEIINLLPDLDFSEPRTLKEGFASYYLAMQCYNDFPDNFTPIFKQAMAALRAAWISNDLHQIPPLDNWDLCSRALYNRARILYRSSINIDKLGTQNIPSDFHLGPDVDKNWRFDGIQYIATLLEYKYGDTTNKKTRHKQLTAGKKTISQIFGIGKSSKAKPSALLENARDLFNKISQELEKE